MPRISNVAKRLVVGRPIRSDRLQETLIPKRIALPIFASDALSSVAYAPEQIILTLSVSGLTAYAASPWIGAVVAIVMLTVVMSYRQTVHAYPSGGGDYEVATTNLGPPAGLVVASALMCDYVLTVAVSVSSGVQNVISAIPALHGHTVEIALAIVVVLTALNLRGIRESGKAFAVPVYCFILGIVGMIIYGAIRLLMGTDLHAESEPFTLRAEGHYAGLGLAFLVLRAFSSGSAALTGVEAISNGVPTFRKPKSKNAATTLLMMGGIAVSMLMGIIILAHLTGLKMAEHTSDLIGAPKDYQQKTVIAQLAKAVFNNFGVGFYFVLAATGIILFLAANTAFSGFPVLGSILAQNRYLPRQLHTRGDKLAFSNGVILLAFFACVLIFAFRGNVNHLIQLYIVGVFVSFNCSQAGMIRHWNRLLKTERDPGRRRQMRRSQTINTIGLTMTAVVLVIVLITKFLAGAWITIVAMIVIFMTMRGIRRHYDRVAEELAPTDDETVLPSRSHVVVLVSKIHKPTLRALAYARATRPDTITALTVNVDEAETRALQSEWERRGLPIALTVIDSPYREITRPVLEYVKSIRRESPRELVAVFIPEYVVGRWWEALLHNQSALRLKTRLLFQPNVMVTNVPWRLTSSDRRIERAQRARERDAHRQVLRSQYGEHPNNPAPPPDAGADSLGSDSAPDKTTQNQ